MRIINLNKFQNKTSDCHVDYHEILDHAFGKNPFARFHLCIKFYDRFLNFDLYFYILMLKGQY